MGISFLFKKKIYSKKIPSDSLIFLQKKNFEKKHSLKILAFLKINIISVKGAQVLTRVWYLGERRDQADIYMVDPNERTVVEAGLVVK
jgi:hypothetical protein